MGFTGYIETPGEYKKYCGHGAEKNFFKSEDIMDKLEHYLNLLEDQGKAERLLGAIATLEMMGYHAEWDVYQKRYFVKKTDNILEVDS